MQSASMIIDELKSILPVHWEEELEELAAVTMDEKAPLRLTLVGAFSVGKSSLLNMLLGETWLPTAMEEATALPTFIEYAPQTSMQLIMVDGSSEAIDAKRFCQVTTSAPQGAACTVLECSTSWLQGVSMIDLPGLGSVSATHAAYTQAQIKQADAVLYLLDPRGPTQKDIDTLRYVRLCGKRIKVLVARWDQVEASIKEGEPAPSLEAWAGQIEAGTGLKVRLSPVSRYGLGRDEIIDFIGRAREDLEQIRVQRLRAELIPILENARGCNQASQQACTVETEAEQQQWHSELLLKKQELSDFKGGLYQQQQQDRQQQQALATDLAASSHTILQQSLTENVASLHDEEDWKRFETQVSHLTRDALLQLAQALSPVSTTYGPLDLPRPQIAALNLRLPQPQEVAAAEFIEMAQLNRLQQQLQVQQQVFDLAEQKIANLTPADTQEDIQALHQWMAQRNQVMSQPLPQVMKTINTGNGAVIGRMLGEVADIGLMFVNPAAVGAKVAAIVGKGAKVANIAVKTGKIAKTVTQGVKFAQVVKGGQNVVPMNPVMEKLSHLEVLSFGHWGEKLGAAIGGGPQQVMETDPEALAEQELALATIDRQIHTLRATLARNEDIANERMLTGHALEESQREQGRLSDEILRLQQQVTQRQQKELLLSQQHRQELLLQYAQQAMQRRLREFDQQAESMIDLLRIRVRDYWEGRVNNLVEQRLLEIDELVVQAKASKSERQRRLQQLLTEAQAIEKALEVL